MCRECIKNLEYIDKVDKSFFFSLFLKFFQNKDKYNIITNPTLKIKGIVT